MEALSQHLKKCEACVYNAKVIEFEDLPEDRKYDFDFYDWEQHILLYCQPCKVYKILPDPLDEIEPLL